MAYNLIRADEELARNTGIDIVDRSISELRGIVDYVGAECDELIEDIFWDSSGSFFIVILECEYDPSSRSESDVELILSNKITRTTECE